MLAVRSFGGCCRRKTAGEKRLAAFEEVRTSTLDKLFRAEAERAFAECADTSSTAESIRLHPQCIKDFDRADFRIGNDCFLTGAAASSGDVPSGLRKFRNRFIEECGSKELTYVVSALASQLAMAHLSTVCYSGCHEFALKSGCTFAKYSIERHGTDLTVTIARASEGFEDFSLPGSEPYSCSKESFIRHHARVLIRIGSEGGIETRVDTAGEAVRLIWPNNCLVVSSDGLELDFASPAAPDRNFRSTAINGIKYFVSPVRCIAFLVVALLWSAGSQAHRMAAALASTFVAAVSLALWKLSFKKRKEL